MESKTAALLTLGCRLNQADSALMCDRLKKMGFEIVAVDAPRSPNLIVVNSCAVTATAFKKTRQALKSMRAENPQSFLVLTGCAANVEKSLQNCDECDLLLPNESKKDIARILPRYLAYLKPDAKLPAPQEPEDGVYQENANSDYPFKSRATLKIQDGCNNFCSYCIVPYARGRERSRALEEVIQDFQQFLQAGFHEVVLSGVNLCTYRCEGTDLAGLLEKLAQTPGNFRLRIGSIEPGQMLDRVIEVMAKYPEKICPFLHIPLQSGSDTILKSMKRKYLTGDFRKFVEHARSLIPHLHLGADLIVGYPEETAKNFEESLQFVRSMHFANLHVFPYSPREGTPAAELKNPITPEELEERLLKVKEVREASAAEFAASLPGTEEMVLVETKRGTGIWEGWSGNYVKTRVISKANVSKQLLRIRFVSLRDDNTLNAEIL